MQIKKHNTVATPGTIVSEKSRGLLDAMVSCVWPEKWFLRDNIAVMRFSGVIGKSGMQGSGLSLDSLNCIIEKAFALPRLTAICLVINSPGGSPVQSELIADRIISLAKEKKVKVYSFVEDVGASGGYWLACAAHEIYASNSSIIGSIGVVSAGFGLQDAISKIGIERRVYTAGRNKSILDPFMPANPDDIEILKKIQLQIHGHFIDYVKDRRAGRLTQSDDILFDGSFWTGQVALDYGLIDGIDNMHNFIKKHFVDNVKIRYVTPDKSWLQRKFSVLANTMIDSVVRSVIRACKSEVKSSKYDME